MNRLRGNIASITVSGSLSLVRVRVPETELSAVVIDTPDTLPWLREGASVGVVFKETEVILASDASVAVSLQNRLVGTVKAVEQGALLSRVTLDTAAGSIVSVITSRAVEQLGLQQGDSAVALIKTNEIMLAE